MTVLRERTSILHLFALVKQKKRQAQSSSEAPQSSGSLKISIR